MFLEVWPTCTLARVKRTKKSANPEAAEHCSDASECWKASSGDGSAQSQ